MAVLIVNNTDRRVQYLSGAGDTVFTYTFEIFADGDLDVYKNEVLLTLTTDYIVTNAGVTGGGDVILTVGADLNDEIVIVGDIAIDQLIDFTIKANFIGTTVQTQYDKMTMIQQQIDTDLNQRGLQYNIFTTVKPNSADNILPQLAANQFWQMNSGATGIFAAELEVDPGANTLRSELISNQNGSDGARIVGYFSPLLGGTFVQGTLARIESKTNGSDGASFVGYFDVSDSTEKTVADKLNDVTQSTPLKNVLIGGDFTTNPFQRGTTFVTLTTGQYVADRFRYSQAGSMVLGSDRETFGAPTVAEAGIFVNHFLEYAVTTSASLVVNDFVTMQQVIEGFNWTRVAQRDFVISFWVRSSITGTFSLAVRSVAAGHSVVNEFTIDTINTWEKKVITIPPSPVSGAWDYETGSGAEVIFVLGAGTGLQTSTLGTWEANAQVASSNQTNFAGTTSATFNFALIQLEEGIIDTNG